MNKMGRYTDFWKNPVSPEQDFEDRGPNYFVMIKEGNKGVESYYFWLINLLKNYLRYTYKRTKGLFASTSGSAVWGQMARRRAEQERRATSIMKGINGMIRSVHEIVRTLRKIDERLDKYKGMDEGSEGDEVALKDYWVTRVEGGTKNPQSVTGLAEKVGFATLPDYFFTTIIGAKENSKEFIEERVNQYDITEKVEYTLKQKLKEFLRWKQRTQQELKTRKEFNIKALASRIHQIILYTEWIEPYLKTISRMQESPEEMEGEQEAALMPPFSTTVLDYQIVAWEDEYTIEKTIAGRTGVEVEDKKYEHYMPTLIVDFKQVSKPSASKRRGRETAYAYPGKIEINLRGRVQEAVKMGDEYVPRIIKEAKKRGESSMVELLSNTVNSSFKALKDDLIKYVGDRLKEEEKLELFGEEVREEGGKEEKEETAPYALLPEPGKMDEFFENFRKKRKDFQTMFKFGEGKKKEEKEHAIEEAESMAWTPYHTFKQATGWFEVWQPKGKKP